MELNMTDLLWKGTVKTLCQSSEYSKWHPGTKKTFCPWLSRSKGNIILLEI